MNIPISHSSRKVFSPQDYADICCELRDRAHLSSLPLPNLDRRCDEVGKKQVNDVYVAKEITLNGELALVKNDATRKEIEQHLKNWQIAHRTFFTENAKLPES